MATWLNGVILHIEYFPIMVLSTLVFTIITVILTPFAYFAIYWNKIFILFTKPNVKKSVLFIDLCLFTISAPFILCVVLVVDVFVFVISLYRRNYKIRKTILNKIDPE